MASNFQILATAAVLLAFFEGSLSQSDTQVENLQYNIIVIGIFEGNCADEETMYESFQLSHYRQEL